MKSLLIILLCVFLAACGEDRRPLVRSSKEITDSVDKAYIKRDTLDFDTTGTSPAQQLKQCLEHYKAVAQIDTFIQTDSGALHIKLKHYCAKDGGIYLPKSYLRKFGLDVFVTHNFVTQVDLALNDKPIYNGVIGKDDVAPLLNGDLKEYGSLLYMDTRVERSRSGKGFVIGYKLVIPLTNMGESVVIGVDRRGNKQGFVNYGSPTEKAYPDSLKKL